MRHCDGDAIVMRAPTTGDFKMAFCEKDCGWWRAMLRDEVYDGGDEGLYSDHLEELQRKLRADGRDDLADHILRMQVELEAA